MDFEIVFTTDYAEICEVHDALYTFNLIRNGNKRIEGLKPPHQPTAGAYILRDSAGTCCGGVVWHWETGEQIFVDYAYVGDNLRGTGQGKRLFGEMEKRVKAEGAVFVEVTTNTYQAPAFYEKIGYTEIHREAAPTARFPENQHYRYRKQLF